MISSEKHEEDLRVLLLKVVNQTIEDSYSLLPVRYRPKRALGRALFDAHAILSNENYTFKYFFDDDEKELTVKKALKMASNSPKAKLSVLTTYIKSKIEAVVNEEVSSMLRTPDVVVINRMPYRIIIGPHPQNIDFEEHIIYLNEKKKDLPTAMHKILCVMLDISDIKARASSIETLVRLLSEFLALNGNIFFTRDVNKCRQGKGIQNDEHQS